jgi:hypothetical protein
MPDNSHPNATSDPTEPVVHHSTFAEGESHPADYPEEEHVGTFAEGESHPADHPEEEQVGTFADTEVRA